MVLGETRRYLLGFDFVELIRRIRTDSCLVKKPTLETQRWLCESFRFRQRRFMTCHSNKVL